MTQEWEISGKFDVGTCFEVAEHFDPISGDRLVRNLCASAKIVVFGAAIPQQGGYQHVNEQYQSYWIKKFQDRGMLPFDVVRPAIWGNDACDWWYQQNIIVYARECAAREFNLRDWPFMADIVHPKLYDWHRNSRSWGGRDMLTALGRKFTSRLKAALKLGE